MDARGPQQWHLIEQYFAAAIDLPAAERSGYLDRSCASDPALRAELERLLRSHEEAGDFLTGTDAPAMVALLEGDEDASALAGPMGPYSVVRRLGRGGMGVVYLAHDARLDRPVALKLLAPHLGEDAEARSRFIREARAASAIDHPHIATIYDIGETPGARLYIAMVYCEGETLRERIRRGPLPVADVLQIALQLADALAAAHRRGIVHRDVKPGNIIVTAANAIRLLDFGIAKLAGSDPDRHAAAAGTIAYMSPEQTRGEATDAATDVWAVGVTLFEMLAGSRPFRAAGDERLVEAIQHDELPPLQTLRPEVTGALAAVVARCLAKSAEERYADGTALLDALRGLSPGAEASLLSRRAVRYVGAIGAVALLALASVLALRPGDASGRAPGASRSATAGSAPAAAAREAPATVAPAGVDRRAYEFFRRAQEYAARGRAPDMEFAIGLYRRALEIDPGFAGARTGLAQSYAISVERNWLGQDWADSAIVEAQAALAVEPGLARAHRALGVAYRSKGWLRKSLEAHTSANALDSTVSPVNVALLHGALGQLDEAVRLYHLAIPKVTSLSRAVLFHNLASTYAGAGLFEKAEVYGQRARELAPDQSTFAAQEIQFALWQDDGARALALAEAHLDAHPGAEAWIVAARAELHAGNPARAREHLERVASPAPTAARELLAAVLWRTGERDRARELYGELDSSALARIAGGDEGCAARRGLAISYLVQGLRRDGYRWLEENLSLGCADYIRIRRDPLLAELHGDTAFERILEAQKRRSEEMRRRIEDAGF